MTTETRIITRTRGDLSAIPPRPSILDQIERAADYARRCRESAELDARRTAESKARRAGVKAADHERRIVRMMRRVGDWVALAAIVADVERTTGVRLSPSSVAHLLGKRGDFERKVDRERNYWRAK